MSDKKPVLFYLLPPPPTLDSIFQELTDQGYEIKKFDMQEYLNEQGPLLLPISNATNLEIISSTLKPLSGLKFKPNIIGFYLGRTAIKVNDAYRLGVKSLFQIPLEQDMLVQKILDLLPVPLANDQVQFHHLFRVSVYEIDKVDRCPLDLFIYLPSNKKVLHFLSKDSVIDEKTLQKFKSKKNYNLYIKKNDMREYQQFCSQLISLTQNDPVLTALEKKKSIQNQLANYMKPFFSEEPLTAEDSQQMIDNLNQLMTNLSDASGDKKQLSEQIEDLTAEKMTNETHAKNVAAYCALFGVTLGIEEPQSLRMGGFLHDLGLADLPAELLTMDEKDMNEDELAKYKLHPGNGKLELEQKKMSAPSMVSEMILLHHERPNGRGFPYGKKSDEIPLAALVCGIADEFDKLTSIRQGYRQFSPLEALLEIENIFLADAGGGGSGSGVARGDGSGVGGVGVARGDGSGGARGDGSGGETTDATRTGVGKGVDIAGAEGGAGAGATSTSVDGAGAGAGAGAGLTAAESGVMTVPGAKPESGAKSVSGVMADSGVTSAAGIEVVNGSKAAANAVVAIAVTNAEVNKVGIGTGNTNSNKFNNTNNVGNVKNLNNNNDISLVNNANTSSDSDRVNNANNSNDSGHVNNANITSDSSFKQKEIFKQLQQIFTGRSETDLENFKVEQKNKKKSAASSLKERPKPRLKLKDLADKKKYSLDGFEIKFKNPETQVAAEILVKDLKKYLEQLAYS